MTELMYQKDSYLRKFRATVTHVHEGGKIALDRSAFFPGGGGQPCDSGMFVSGEEDWRVAKVTTTDRNVLHWIEGDSKPVIGQSILGTLNWERRFQLMRTHTAMHILCGVVWRDHGVSVTGGNMHPLQGRLDFEFENISAAMVQEIEQSINVEVEAAREVVVNILPREDAFAIPDLIRTKINLLPEGITEIRTVEIVGLDLQADGGTHVANTLEVGEIRIVDYKSKGKSNKRIVVAIDE